MSTVTESQFTDSGWSGCPQGEIGTMVHRLKTRRFLTMVRRDATVLTLLMVGLFSGYFYFGVLPEIRGPQHLALNCCDVQPLAEQMLSGQLDDKTRDDMQQHLKYCEFCRKFVEDMRTEAMQRGREGDRHDNWDKIRNPEIVAQRGRMQLQADAIRIVD